MLSSRTPALPVMMVLLLACWSASVDAFGLAGPKKFLKSIVSPRSVATEDNLEKVSLVCRAREELISLNQSTVLERYKRANPSLLLFIYLLTLSY
jgi:hypothetical protein